MITIKKLDEMYEEFILIGQNNNDLFEKQEEILIDLMMKYRPIVRWYIEKELYLVPNDLNYLVGYTFILAESETYIYYWDYDDAHIKRFDKIDRMGLGYYDTILFVKNGHFEEARKNLLQLNESMSHLIEMSQTLNDNLKTSLI